LLDLLHPRANISICQYFGEYPTTHAAFVMYQLTSIPDNNAGEVETAEQKEAKESLSGALNTEI